MYSIKKQSAIALVLIAVFFISFRLGYIKDNNANGYNATSWDALGYYMYLPSAFIYNDFKNIDWIEKIDSTYHVTGGKLYQAIYLENQKGYTNKYLCGVAIMQLPFFLLAHSTSGLMGYPADGFSAPYQYAILFAAIFWALIGFYYLRKILQLYFDELTTASTMLFIALTSNLVQYVSVDGGMSHAFIFPLYAIVIWLTIKWHQSAKAYYATAIGLVIGLATISRPTEIIMLFIPLLWNTQSKLAANEKWNLIKTNYSHLLYAAIGVAVGVLPQLLYWKYTTGSFVFDVGSKWFFLNPWFRVLVGTEIGWFIYTPVALLMVLGFFYMRNMPFRKSVLVFCLLNIWIIISWSDWKYGATYSARALTQSYPVFALALASFIAYLLKSKRNYLIAFMFVMLLVLNIYQLHIYNNKYIIHSFSPIVTILK